MRDSSHTAGDSQGTADDLEIELLWLPVRSPHQLFFACTGVLLTTATFCLTLAFIMQG